MALAAQPVPQRCAMQPRPLRRLVPPLAPPHSLLLRHHRRMQPQPLARQPRAALSTLCLPRERSPLEALRRKMREAWMTHDLERSLPASSMLCVGAVARHSPSQSSPVGRLAAQLQFKNKQKRRTGAHPLPLTRTKGDEAFYRPRGRQHGVPLRVHGSPLRQHSGPSRPAALSGRDSLHLPAILYYPYHTSGFCCQHRRKVKNTQIYEFYHFPKNGR